MHVYTTNDGRAVRPGDLLRDKRGRYGDAVRVDQIGARTIDGQRIYQAQCTLLERSTDGTLTATGTRRIRVQALTTWAFERTEEA